MTPGGPFPLRVVFAVGSATYKITGPGNAMWPLLSKAQSCTRRWAATPNPTPTPRIKTP